MGTLRTTLNHRGQTVNGVLLGDPATPAYYTYDHPALPDGQILDDGTVLVYDAAVVDDPTAVANRETIKSQARSALTTNRTYVALASPTNAQVAAQVKALTRQMNALIRLTLGQLDGTD